MRYFKFIILSLILAVVFVFVFDRKSFCWSLFDLFKNSKYSKDELVKVENFNPDDETLFLPELEDKLYFETVEDLSICRKKDVRKFLYVYLTTGREYTIRSIIKSHKYLPIIEKIFDENPDIPKDLMYLPLLESGFNPFAVSRTKAMGLWQFVKITGKAVGLKNNRWVDERRDIEKSTRAAIRHLRSQYTIFGNWEKALAAYNGGAGYLKRTMNKTNTKDLWDLIENNKLRTETNEYVPRFTALLLIYKNQDLFEISDEINNQELVKTENLRLKYPVKIQQVSSITGIPVNVIREYNPELKGDITPPYEKGYTLRLPKQAKEKLAELEKDIYKIKFTRLHKHKVKRGESISILANRFKSTVEGIVFINQIPRPDFLKPGYKLFIPIGMKSIS